MSLRDTYLEKKELIASNLTFKGVEADSSMGLTTLANKILEIEGEPIEETTKNILVQLIWDDNENQDGNRPDSVTLVLYANGVNLDPVTISAAEGWSHTFTDLPIYDEDNGEEINYTITQRPIDSYTPIFTGYTIREDYTPEITSATVRKVWDDDNNAQSIRPSRIVMTLSNGQKVVLNDTNGWIATINNLPTRLNGEPVTYTWTEQEEILGYTKTNETTNGTVTTFTNATNSVPTPPDVKPPKG